MGGLEMGSAQDARLEAWSMGQFLADSRQLAV